MTTQEELKSLRDAIDDLDPEDPHRNLIRGILFSQVTDILTDCVQEPWVEKFCEDERFITNYKKALGRFNIRRNLDKARERNRTELTNRLHRLQGMFLHLRQAFDKTGEVRVDLTTAEKFDGHLVTLQQLFELGDGFNYVTKETTRERFEQVWNSYVHKSSKE